MTQNSPAVTILGAGIAGCLLAYTLLRRGWSVQIFELESRTFIPAHHATLGIMNPILGQRFTSVPDYKMWFDHAKITYSVLENDFQTTCFHEIPLVRLFRSELEKSRWLERSSSLTYADFALNNDDHEDVLRRLHRPFDCFVTKYSGLVNISMLILAMHQKFEAENILKFLKNPREAAVNSSSDFIIDCTGAHTPDSVVWSWLPFKPTKGEILDVEIENFPQSHIIIGEAHIAPLGKNIFRIGGTFDTTDQASTPTQSGLFTLEEHLQQTIVNVKYKILQHKAAFRPTTLDHKPFAGQHPELPRFYVFGGLGTRSAVFAPYFASLMADFLEHKSPIPREYSVERFWHRL